MLASDVSDGSSCCKPKPIGCAPIAPWNLQAQNKKRRRTRVLRRRWSGCARQLRRDDRHDLKRVGVDDHDLFAHDEISKAGIVLNDTHGLCGQHDHVDAARNPRADRNREVDVIDARLAVADDHRSDLRALLGRKLPRLRRRGALAAFGGRGTGVWLRALAGPFVLLAGAFAGPLVFVARLLAHALVLVAGLLAHALVLLAGLLAGALILLAGLLAHALVLLARLLAGALVLLAGLLAHALVLFFVLLAGPFALLAGLLAHALVLFAGLLPGPLALLGPAAAFAGAAALPAPALLLQGSMARAAAGSARGARRAAGAAGTLGGGNAHAHCKGHGCSRGQQRFPHRSSLPLGWPLLLMVITRRESRCSSLSGDLGGCKYRSEVRSLGRLTDGNPALRRERGPRGPASRRDGGHTGPPRDANPGGAKIVPIGRRRTDERGRTAENGSRRREICS